MIENIMNISWSRSRHAADRGFPTSRSRWQKLLTGVAGNALPSAFIFAVSASTVFCGAALIKPSFQSYALLYFDVDRSVGLEKRPESPDVAARQDRFIYSQSQVITSESVVRGAVDQFGDARLNGQRAEDRSWLNAIVPSFYASLGGHDRTYATAWSSLSVRAEPKTDLLRVSFSSDDPRKSADFLRTLLDVYISHSKDLAARNASPPSSKNSKKNLTSGLKLRQRSSPSSQNLSKSTLLMSSSDWSSTIGIRLRSRSSKHRLKLRRKKRKLVRRAGNLY